MADITPDLVKKLREKTGAGMMECKAALVEAGGDLEQAETILRKRGIAKADKKADRATKEGIIHAFIDPAACVGVLAEVNCETDFVAKNEGFKNFVNELCKRVAQSTGSGDAALSDPAIVEFVKAKIAEVGENIVFRRFVRYDGKASGQPGHLQSYIHLAGRVGVLIEVAGGNQLAGKDAFLSLVKDLCLHVAAASPRWLRREDVPADVIAKEREIAGEQVKGKPANVVDKIVDGKMNKFYADYCLLEQPFIKDPDATIADLIKGKASELGEDVVVRRFTRYAVGGE